MNLSCNGAVKCSTKTMFVCRCGKCCREEDVEARFYACKSREHLVAASKSHKKLFGRLANWIVI